MPEVCLHCEVPWCNLLGSLVDLTQHATILAYMMSIIENNKVTSPLFDATDPSNSGTNNLMFVQTSMAKLLKQAFPHLQE